MSDDLYFQVFYGSGEVRYGPEGVDLSEFSSITKKIDMFNFVSVIGN